MSITIEKNAPSTKSTVESIREEALQDSKSSKKAKNQHDKVFYAMQALQGLVDSGCEQVSIKTNKSGSVMWVKVLETEEVDALKNAVINNIRKAAGAIEKGRTCTSFTLSKSGYIGLHTHAPKK